MSGVNKVMIIGRLGAEPDFKYLADGTAVCKCSVATSETWKDKDGGKQERTEWHRITLWKRLAEIAGEYLHKGSQAYFEGRIQTHDYVDKEGVKRYSTEILAKSMQLLDSKRDAKSERDYYGDPPPDRASDNGPLPDDDIPF
jgi:single-strand DNA-binding protein